MPRDPRDGSWTADAKLAFKSFVSKQFPGIIEENTPYEEGNQHDKFSLDICLCVNTTSRSSALRRE